MMVHGSSVVIDQQNAAMAARIHEFHKATDGVQNDRRRRARRNPLEQMLFASEDSFRALSLVDISLQNEPVQDTWNQR
jgi:hypothetical protein